MAERKAPARKPATRKADGPGPNPEPSPAGLEPHPTGYVGDLPDETPNEHYTLRGVITGLPVPEHDK